MVHRRFGGPHRRRALAPDQNPEADLKRRALVDFIVVAGAIGVVVQLLPWALILDPTTPTGGDTPSHYEALVYFKNYVLPQGRLWGWHPGNLAGYPIFQFYFPLPYVLGVLLGKLFPLSVAFKLIVLLPALVLPLSVYLSLRQLGLAFPGPAAGAVMALSFVLGETNRLWGGNVPSMLAGEFCYGWALNLTLIYLGRVSAWLNGRKGPVLPAVLLGLIGLCHAYALLFSLTAGLYFLLRPGRFKVAAARLLLVYGLGFLLLAHWAVPMLAYSPYTEMFNFIWIVDSWRNFLPTTLLPVMVIALGGIGLGWRRREDDDNQRLGYLLFWVFSAAFLFLAAPFMNAVTIRFGPFAHLAAVLLAAQGLELAVRRLAAKEIIALVILVAGAVWPVARLTYIPNWLDWNNAGLERRAPWPRLKELFEYLKGDFSMPRVAYEHSALNHKAGSVRIFESLPLLAGRATLEGLYIQASPNAPFIFYIQSETCQHGSSPLPGYLYSRLNLPRALEHLRLYNVSQYIVVDPKTRKLADEQKGLMLEREFGSFSVYRVEENENAYAVRPECRPLLVITPRPQEVAYDWFRFTDLKVPLVLAPRRTAVQERLFPRVFVDSGQEDDPLLALLRRDALPRFPLAPRRVGEKVSPEKIELRGLAPGEPVMIKMSFHPAWQAQSGERVWRVSPAFMLVFPRAETLTLAFKPAGPHLLGLGLTAFGAALCLILLLKPSLGRRGWLKSPPAPSKPQGPSRLWLKVVLFGLGLAALASLYAVLDDAATLRRRARSLTAQGRLEEARPLFRASIERFPLSLVVDYAWYDLAMTYVTEQKWPQAEKLLRQFLERYPDSVALPEALYHLGLSLERQGRREEALAFFRRLKADFPDNPWTKHAAQWLQ